MNCLDRAPRAGVFRDIHAIYDLTEVTPGLPLPAVSPARATFDYRHVVHAEAAREAVSCARTILGYAFGVTFAESTETAGDDTPRYLLTAALGSGLRLVIVSRVTLDADQDERDDAERLVAA